MVQRSKRFKWEMLRAIVEKIEALEEHLTQVLAFFEQEMELAYN